jgi:hypothetical protein
MQMPRIFKNEKPRLHAVTDTNEPTVIITESAALPSPAKRELQAMEVCYHYLEPLTPEARHRALLWLAEVLKVS